MGARVEPGARSVRVGVVWVVGGRCTATSPMIRSLICDAGLCRVGDLTRCRRLRCRSAPRDRVHSAQPVEDRLLAQMESDKPTYRLNDVKAHANRQRGLRQLGQRRDRQPRELVSTPSRRPSDAVGDGISSDQRSGVLSRWQAHVHAGQRASRSLLLRRAVAESGIANKRAFVRFKSRERVPGWNKR